MLIFPAAFFMISLFMRSAFQPANIPEAIVTWYSGRMWTLWVLLLGLPFAVLVIGCSTLLRSWRDDAAFRQAAGQTLAAIRAHLAMLLVAVTTAMAGGVLVIVILHMAAN
jgi:anti-sigma factor RsiW